MTNYGTWSVSNNKTVTITWSFGIPDSETWDLTWFDENPNDGTPGSLYKMELRSANYTQYNTFYYTGTGRNKDAANVGWAVGAPGTGFGTAVDSLSTHMQNYEGVFHQFKAAVPTLDPVKRLSFNWAYVGSGDATLLASPTFGQTQGSIRGFVSNDPNVNNCDGTGYYDVLRYLSKYPNQGSGSLLNRRVFYQICHDGGTGWGSCDGQVANVPQHIHSGHQIIDTNGDLRGFVFAESTQYGGTPYQSSISGAWYMPASEATADALCGIDPSVNETTATCP